MKRTVYSCDWCSVDAPKADERPNEWKNVDLTIVGRPNELLCTDCVKQVEVTMREAVQKARENVRKAQEATARMCADPKPYASGDAKGQERR